MSSISRDDPRRKRSPTEILKLTSDLLKALFRALLMLFSGEGRARRRKPKPWHVFISSTGAPDAVSQGQIEHLINRHRVLGDAGALATFATQFHMTESDFFGNPDQVLRLMERIIVENPPWLHINRVLAGGEAGSETHSQEFLYREQVVRDYQDVELFIPDDSWKDRPLSSLTVRPARSISEVWQARLLDQVLPPTVILDRCNRGEILVPVRDPRRQRLDFCKEIRRMEVVTRRQVPIPVETDGGNGSGGQLLYILLDFSASMRGIGAVVAMAAIAATLRAHLGQYSTRYLFRRYAQREQMWPNRAEKPVTSSTLEEKDRLLATILATNFNGSATDVNDALAIAAEDIERLRRDEHLEAEILLVTDGRAEVLESTRLTLLRARAKVHTVMVIPEPNPGLEQISESYTALDIGNDTAA